MKEFKEKKVNKVVTSQPKERKKTLANKFAEAFISEDIESVSSFVIKDVLLPNIKDTIYKMFIGSLEMIFYGSTKSVNKTHSGDKVSYNAYYVSDKYKNNSQRTSRITSYEDVVLPRAELEAVLDTLEEVISRDGSASVGDLCDALGIESSFTDQKYGWRNISTARVKLTRDGYVLSMPRTIYLD